MFFERLFGFRAKAVREEKEKIGAILASTESLLAAAVGEHSQTKIPEELGARCRDVIASTKALLGSADESLEALRAARERLGALSNELAQAAFENASGPTFTASSLEDVVGQVMKRYGKKDGP